jgi:hypothetical protein
MADGNSRNENRGLSTADSRQHHRNTFRPRLPVTSATMGCGVAALLLHTKMNGVKSMPMFRTLYVHAIAFVMMLGCLQGARAQGAIVPVNGQIPASAAPDTRHERSNVMIWAYVGPGAYLADASVEIFDAGGKLVATGQTGTRGVLTLTVPGSASETEPYLVVSSGGKVGGVPFHDHLKAYIQKLSFGDITYLDLVSTAAQALSAKSPDSYIASISQVYAALGLKHYDARGVLRVANPVVGLTELQAKIAKAGGIPQFVNTLAVAAGKRQHIDGLKPQPMRFAGSKNLGATANTQAMASPCKVQFESAAPSASFVSWNTVTDFGILAGTDLINGWTAGSGSNLIQGVAGFALAGANIGGDQTTNQINANLAAIDVELDCISSQIGNLQATMDEMTLANKIGDLSDCLTGITTEYGLYAFLVADAAKHPLNADNHDLAAMFDPSTGTTPKALSNCKSMINSVLFSASGGAVPAWQTLVSNTQTKNVNGNAVPMPKLFLPSDVYWLQVFLSYYAAMEYQQSVLQSEEYNYRATFLNDDLTQTARFMMYGGEQSGCSASSTVPNPVAVDGNATNFCQWQLNIASVWPETIFSDEIALCTQCDEINPVLTGIAIVAVPAGLVTPVGGKGTTLPTPGSFNNVNPRSLASSCISANGSKNCNFSLPGSEGAKVLAKFNTYPVQTPSNPNSETYWTRQVIRKATATSEQVTALSGNPNTLNYAVATLSGWLNAKAPVWSNVVVTGQPNMPTAPTPDLNSPLWTLLTAQSNLAAKFSQSSKTSCHTPAGTRQQQCQTIDNYTDSVTISGALFNAGYNYTPCNKSANPCSANSFPATPNAAYLMQRSWTNGTGYTGSPQ